MIVVSRPSIVVLKSSKQIKLDPDNNLQIDVDLRAFVSARTQTLSELLNFSTQFREHVEKSLLDSSEGTFLWVGLAIRELLQKQNWAEVEAALDSLPRGLPAVYDRMILQIPEQHIHFSSIILRWVTLAVRPLSVRELSEVLQCRQSTTIATEQMVRDRIATCGSLVHINNGFVSLVHESARDYFLRDKGSDIQALERFRIHQFEVHLEIACLCLATIEKNWQYLRRERRLYALFEREPGYQAALPTPDPMLNYAIFHWPDHARQALQDFSELFRHAPSFFAEKSQLLVDWCRSVFFPDKRWEFHFTQFRSISALSVACYLGIDEWVQELLTVARKSILWLAADRKDESGKRPLQYAACGSRTSVISILLEHGANVNGSNQTTGLPYTALLKATEHGNTAAVRLLLDRGASTRDHQYLHSAAQNDSNTVLGLLLDRGADIEVVADTGGHHCILRHITETKRQSAYCSTEAHASTQKTNIR